MPGACYRYATCFRFRFTFFGVAPRKSEKPSIEAAAAQPTRQSSQSPTRQSRYGDGAWLSTALALSFHSSTVLPRASVRTRYSAERCSDRSRCSSAFVPKTDKHPSVAYRHTQARVHERLPVVRVDVDGPQFPRAVHGRDAPVVASEVALASLVLGKRLARRPDADALGGHEDCRPAAAAVKPCIDGRARTWPGDWARRCCMGRRRTCFRGVGRPRAYGPSPSNADRGAMLVNA